MAAAPKLKLVRPRMEAFPHNGEGRPELQFPDPVNGEMIGGQRAAVRMAMRYRHTVFPWARRQGKTKFRQFLAQSEACITSGRYFYGICYPDHTTAYKVAQDFIHSWGSFVKDARNPPDHQDRWIELHPFSPPQKTPPTWFTEPMKERWARCYEGKPNTFCKIYLWSTVQYERIQGFPHHFNRVGWDECQQTDPRAYGIVRPMCDDIGAPEEFSGTPWNTGMGNVKFENWWDIAGDPTNLDWFRMRIPHGTNPHVKKQTREDWKGMPETEIRQVKFAEFLSGEGSVFGNLDAVFVLKPMDPENGDLDWIRALRSKYAMPTMQWWVHHPESRAGHVYGASVDWARSPTGDYSVMIVMDFTTAEQVALLRWRGEDITAQMEVVDAVCEHYGARQLHSDANGIGIPMSDFMRRRHGRAFIGHKFGRNKPDYVRRGQILFTDEDVKMIDCGVQRGEFKSYSMTMGGRQLVPGDTISGERQIQYSAPPGEYDDCVAAFLQIAPTMTVVGRQAAPEMAEPEPPMFDDKWNTTLERFTDGAQLPWRSTSDGISWNDVVVPS
jgi:hypothetical protein